MTTTTTPMTTKVAPTLTLTLTLLSTLIALVGCGRAVGPDALGDPSAPAGPTSPAGPTVPAPPTTVHPTTPAPDPGLIAPLPRPACSTSTTTVDKLAGSVTVVQLRAAKGTVHAVYSRGEPLVYASGVQYAAVASGKLLKAPLGLCLGGSCSSAVSLALDAAGDPHVALGVGLIMSRSLAAGSGWKQTSFTPPAVEASCSYGPPHLQWGPSLDVWLFARGGSYRLGWIDQACGRDAVAAEAPAGGAWSFDRWSLPSLDPLPLTGKSTSLGVLRYTAAHDGTSGELHQVWTTGEQTVAPTLPATSLVYAAPGKPGLTLRSSKKVGFAPRRLLVDGQGHAHLLYLEQVPGNKAAGVWYATNRGGTWTHEPVPPQVTAGNECLKLITDAELAVGAAGEVYVALKEQQPSCGYLQVARRHGNGKGWTHCNVASKGEGQLAIAAEGDVAHVGFFDASSFKIASTRFSQLDVP